MAKLGRPTVLPDRPMTGAERMRRCRYFKGWVEWKLNRMLGRKHGKAPRQHNWNREAPTDILGLELAWACFDPASHKVDYNRWDEIDRYTRKRLAEIELEFPVSSLIR